MASTYKLTIGSDAGSHHLTFGGDLIINHIDKMLGEVRGALDPVTDVEVTLDAPDNIDMTFLQLVVSIRHTCEAAGKQFSINGKVKPDIKELVRKAGLEAELNV